MKILFAITLVWVCLVVGGRELKMIEVVIRHGVRYPQFPNDYDHSNITVFDGALKQLTPEGRQMHYLLGRAMFKKYWKEIFEGTEYVNKLNRSMLYVRSTDTNRTIQSAQNFMFGFLSQLEPQNLPFSERSQVYPPFDYDLDELTQDQFYTGWEKSHLVPIHIEKGAGGQTGVVNEDNQGDFLVKLEPNLCPNQKIWENQAYTSEYITLVSQQPLIVKAIQTLQPFFPTIPLNIRNIFKYVDNYACLKHMGKPYLKIFQDPEIKQYLDYLYISRLYTVFLFSQQQRKVFSKTLLETTINNMKNSIEQIGPKVILYSAHDSTIGTLLASMNFTNLECIYQKYIKNNTQDQCYWQYPHFASSFVFQLWQQDNKAYSVEVSINGRKYNLPFCNYKQSCSLQSFQKWHKSYTIKTTPNQACGVKQIPISSFHFQDYFLAFTFVSLLVFYFLSKRNRRHGSGHQIFSDEQLST